MKGGKRYNNKEQRAPPSRIIVELK